MIISNCIHGLIRLVIETPIWVWGILGYILYVGIAALKPREIFIPKLFIIPIVFLALKVPFYIQMPFLAIAFNIAELALSAWVSFRLTSCKNVIIPSRKHYINLPGSQVTLLVLVCYFLVKYAFGYMEAAQLELYQKMYTVEYSLSAIFTGVILGRALRYYIHNLKFR